MNFSRQDLDDINNNLLSLAARVVPMRDISKGDIDHRVIGLRHDVDDNPRSFDTAMELAQWEFEHGYSSTYYLLHGAWYWDADHLVQALELPDLGHEVGIPVNAIAEALRTKLPPDEILADALYDMRSVGLHVDGCVAHGDPFCRDQRAGNVVFVNDEMFLESPRPTLGSPTRAIWRNGTSVKLQPRPRDAYGLRYDANWLTRGNYLSDSGGAWSQPLTTVIRQFGITQLHILMHPDWWARAFPKVTVNG
jgi:hypothetical protein